MPIRFCPLSALCAGGRPRSTGNTFPGHGLTRLRFSSSHAGNASSNLAGVTSKQGILISVGAPWRVVANMCHPCALWTLRPFRFATLTASFSTAHHWRSHPINAVSLGRKRGPARAHSRRRPRCIAPITAQPKAWQRGWGSLLLAPARRQHQLPAGFCRTLEKELVVGTEWDSN